MTITSNNSQPRKAAICIREMAALCGLSRQRFMQLVKVGVFPAPNYDVATRRPFYSEDLQAQCVEVRKRNVGINGKVVMFYARRPTGLTTTPKVRKEQTPVIDAAALADIVFGVRRLGVTTATPAQVRKAIAQQYPRGIEGLDVGTVAGKVFSHLKGKNS